MLDVEVLEPLMVLCDQSWVPVLMLSHKNLFTQISMTSTTEASKDLGECSLKAAFSLSLS